MTIDPDGQKAVTDGRLRGAADGLAWLELHPRTGRTHQVRVHCASLGCPVLGDPVYGADPPAMREKAGGLHLLARAIRLDLDPPLAAEAPVPAHMRRALALTGWNEAG
jgi:tRNA pseudouridine32 synthase/23S rRNA pseudouridine746 synthase